MGNAIKLNDIHVMYRFTDVIHAGFNYNIPTNDSVASDAASGKKKEIILTHKY